MKQFTFIFLTLVCFSILYSCKKDETVKINDPITGDYLCQDIYHYSYQISYDTTNQKYIYNTIQYDSTYLIHYDFKKDSNNLVRFQSEVFSLTDSNTYDYVIYSNGGHINEHLKFINDSVYFSLDYYAYLNNGNKSRLIQGKKIK